MESTGGRTEEEEEERIKETVMGILKRSNMEETTEFKVRKTASDSLSLDLSTPHRKLIVRSVVEAYLNDQTLLAQIEDNDQITKYDDEGEDDDDIEKNRNMGTVKDYDDDGDLIICKLSDKRRVTIQDFKGKTLVSMREYYKKDGKELPTAKGISLTAEQWSIFKKNVPAIEKAIQKMESRLH